MGPRCSSAETQVCHRSYIIAASVMVSVLTSGVVDRGFIGGVIPVVSVLASSAVDRGF